MRQFDRVRLRFVVYELIDNKGNVIYIGQSRNFHKRLFQHNNKEWFKYVQSINCHLMQSYPDCAFLEAQLIAIYRPLFNKRLMGNNLSQNSILPLETIFYFVDGIEKSSLSNYCASL